jgi:hypothetical protein
MAHFGAIATGEVVPIKRGVARFLLKSVAERRLERSPTESTSDLSIHPRVGFAPGVTELEKRDAAKAAQQGKCEMKMKRESEQETRLPKRHVRDLGYPHGVSS